MKEMITRKRMEGRCTKMPARSLYVNHIEISVTVSPMFSGGVIHVAGFYR
jgi:hypothetical protein